MPRKSRGPARITTDLTTTTLIATVAADLDITPKEATRLVYATFDVIARAAASGHNVAITNFGTFRSYRLKKHNRRNPQTGEKIPVPAHQVMRFRISPRFAQAVRNRDRKFTIRKLPQGTLTPGKVGAADASRP
ncbi:HU family DNA-binding protein [Streptomyces sp. NPDC054802]